MGFSAINSSAEKMCAAENVVDGPGAFSPATFSINCLNVDAIICTSSILMWLTIIIYDLRKAAEGSAQNLFILE
jgi:hypothetical protein